ncbi:MAG: AMP-binding protein [Defluviicoccus sp.]|nr:AMP-binding protein [Defluviicoccus sp.]
MSGFPESGLPIYHASIDWAQLHRDYPVPDVFEKTVYKWPADRVRDLQNERFLRCVEHTWNNPFYRKRWRAAGLEPGDVTSIDDSHKIPTYNSDDVKRDQLENPPFGEFHNVGSAERASAPLKMQTSGGTTGKPRVTLYRPQEWELNGLTAARTFYLQGARPGDVLQIPVTLALGNLGWCVYKAVHDYLGVLPLTTGTGVVTPSRRQMEIAFDYGTNLWCSFPEYMLRLAQASRDELGRDFRELGTKFVLTFLGPDTKGALRGEMEDVLGCDVYDNYGTNEMGGGAFECRYKNGLHFSEDCMYFEIVDTETGEPVPDGESGNLVVTVFYRALPPIVRFNLRDLGRILHTDTCDCGSNFRRMDHFLGRSDDMVKLRGVNLNPMACLNAVTSDERTTGEWVCIAETVERRGIRRDEMTVRIEVRNDAGSAEGLKERMEDLLRGDLGLGVTVELVPQGSLDEIANVGGREGKAKRLVDRRPDYRN